MALRYWVGGTASWDGTAGTKWAATSGGTGGETVPTSADDVFFDANSGTGTVTIATGNTGAKSITCTGFTGTLAGTAFISVAGNITLVSGMTFTYAGSLRISDTSTLITAGKTLGELDVNASAKTVTLGDALTCSAGLIVTAGTFTTSNYAVTAAGFTSSNNNTRAINLDSSTVTLSGNVTFTTITSLTFNAGTSQINISTTSPTFSGGGLTFYNVSFTSTTAGTRAITGANTYNNLSVTAPSAAGITQVSFDNTQTINGQLSTTGTAGNRRVWFRTETYGIQRTLFINGTTSLTDADFRDILVFGTAAPISGTRIGNLRGCTGITFSTPKTVYWNLAGAQNWSATGWATTSTGTPSDDNFPLAQDTATFTDAGSVTGTITMNSVIPYTGTVDMSGRTSAMTLSLGSGQTIYGNWKNGSGTTLSGSQTLTFSGRNTQTITSAGKTFIGAITIDSYGGTVELADALNTGSNSITVNNGTFDTKNYNVTCGQISSDNTNVRTISLGSSTVTTDANTMFNAGNTTNLTFNAGTSTLVTINASGSLTGNLTAGPPLTFYNVNFNYVGSPTITYSITGTNTFNNITVTAPSTAGFATLSLSADQTINGTLTVAGATAVRRIFVRSNTIGTARTMSVGTLSATDCDFRDITITGTAAGSSPTRAGNCGGNSGITFPAAKTVYWNLAGTQNWSADGWATTSGGTPATNNFPLAQDTAVFDNTGAVGTVTVERAWNIGTLNMSGRTNACTIDWSNSSPTGYGNVLLGSGVTPGTTGTYLMAGRGTQTITSGGNTWSGALTINSATGTVQLADAFTMISSRLFTLTTGTFDAVSYNVTIGSFALGLGVKTLKMGSGTWTLSGTGGNIWDITTSNLTFYKGTANILLSDNSTSSRSFLGAGLSYNKLTIGGTTSTSTTTITGNNQFTELASTKTVAHTIALGSTTQTFGKWTVTGTAGNVVTVTGTGTSHVIAGSATSGLDYLAMGTIGFASTSPGEFYAGANSTGTGSGVILTAPPAGRTLYWVGGTGNWNDTARWSTSSGGGGGAALPTSLDDVIFDSASNATAYTSTVNATTRVKSLTISGPASGNLTLAGTSVLIVHGNITLPATGLTQTFTGNITLTSSSGGKTLTTNGVTLSSNITINGVDCGWSLGSALDIGANALTVTNGSFNLATYNLNANEINSDNGNSRTIDFSSGTASISGNSQINFGTTETNRANLTVTAGTSQITCSGSTPTISGNNQTFYNVSFTSSLANSVTISGVNSFNNLTFAGLTSSGLKTITLNANQTVTGTLTFSAGTDATRRNFVRSDTLGTTRTITAAAFSGTDVDFRDITITGAAAPISGTRLGDCKGNSGITFPAPKTVYCRATTTANWNATTSWAATNGGTADITQFPLAQDTAVFSATYPNSGVTITIPVSYNISTIDMSARTTNTMTLATSSNTQTIYGNWINGTGTTLSGTGRMTFSGRGSQTITSAGITFTQPITIDSPSGSVTLQDAFVCNNNSSTALVITSGTFDAASYNVSMSGSNGGVSLSGTTTRTVAVGSGTWTLSGTGGNIWDASTSTNLTVTGTGVISGTGTTAKTFAGGNIAYTNITLNQGGAGTLGITGNNTFKDITNSASGPTAIALSSTIQTVTSFSATGFSGRTLTITGTSASSPARLILTGATKPQLDYVVLSSIQAYPTTSTWEVGTTWTNSGSLGFTFNAFTPSLVAGNFLMFF